MLFNLLITKPLKTQFVFYHLMNSYAIIILILYLFTFNLFIIDKVISITTGIAFHRQQDLSQTHGAVNKIAECWYCCYQTFKTKSPFVVLIKVNPKQKLHIEYKNFMDLIMYAML